MNRYIFFLLFACLTSSCATILTGTKDNLYFKTDPPGATVKQNGLALCKSPCGVPVKRKWGNTFVSMGKEGFENETILLQKKFNGWSLLNLWNPFAWGIDAATASILKYDRKSYRVTMTPLAQQPKVVASANPEPVTNVAEDQNSPVIELIAPEQSRGFKPVVKTRNFTIIGVVSDNQEVTSARINGNELSLSNAGQFRYPVTLREGDNSFIIEAKDASNNESRTSLNLTFQPGNENVIVGQEVLTSPGEYYALVIGVQDYNDPEINDLSQPLNDARLLYDVLTEHYTFEEENITFLRNPTKNEITQSLDYYFDKVTEKDNFLVFYAGHGYWDEKFEQGYWLAADARNKRRGTWISNSTVRDYLRAIPSRHSLLVTDACFAGGIFKSRNAFSNASAAVTNLHKLPSRKAMTSGALSEVPDNSAFIKYMVKRLEENNQRYLPSEQLFASFKIAVINNSSIGQVPQYGEIKETGDEGGDFIFIRK